MEGFERSCHSCIRDQRRRPPNRRDHVNACWVNETHLREFLRDPAFHYRDLDIHPMQVLGMREPVLSGRDSSAFLNWLTRNEIIDHHNPAIPNYVLPISYFDQLQTIDRAYRQARDVAHHRAQTATQIAQREMRMRDNERIPEASMLTQELLDDLYRTMIANVGIPDPIFDHDGRPIFRL